MNRFVGLSVLLALFIPVAVSAQKATPRLASANAGADPARDAALLKLNAFLARYPDSPLRPAALFQAGELLVRQADDEFAEAQRAVGAEGRGEVPVRPNYAPAVARYEELVRRYPNYEKIDAAAYTLGTVYFAAQRYADAARMFEIVTQREGSRFRGEANFRLGDSYFELAARERGEPRRALFARAAQAYENATSSAARDGDIYFLSLYKLGWSYYNQANRSNQEEYRKAVEVFGRLVAEYDKLTPEQQARLGLRSEAIEYMAVAFTQVGGADAANRYFSTRSGGDAAYKLPVLRRVAASLRDQGEFPRAVEAYRAVIAEAPSDSAALAAQREIVDIFQNRIIEADSAQRARLELVEKFAPGTPWANANTSLASQASAAREEALRQSAQYSLSQAQRRGNKERFAEAAQLYTRYLSEFSGSDSAQIVSLLAGEALFGQGEYAAAGAVFSRAAYGFSSPNPKVAVQAGQNAIVAFDSALVRNKTDRAAQDSLFAAVDHFVATFPENADLGKKALIQKGRRASETQRWTEMAAAFRTYAEKYPSDAYTPTAQKLIGDALYRQGQYAEAQAQWESAQAVASQSGRRSLADSIRALRTAAAAGFADSLVKSGDYDRAAEEVYVAFADKNPNSDRAPEALRNAIETYVLADSVARARNDGSASRKARERAIELSKRLVSQYPSYRYRAQYQSLQARFLGEMGRREEAVEAMRQLIRDNPAWPGRDDVMVQLAVTLDSLGNNREAAQVYEQFSAAYPKDARAADAQFNAAVTYLDAGDSTAAGRAYATFARRFPRDARAAQARQSRVALLQASGDSAAADTELRVLCASPTADMKATCAARTAEAAFRQGAEVFPRYQALKLVISSKAQLTRAGVDRASARKRQLLKTMSDHFKRAIATGSPEWLSASTYYIGLAQWEYGEFLKNVQLPSNLTDEERAAAAQGSAQQAEQFYAEARKTWQSLIQKAEKETISNVWVDRARAALDGKVPDTPPTSRGAVESLLVSEGAFE